MKENSTQVMIKALARLRLSGFESPYGTMPQNAEQYKIQAESYVDAITSLVGNFPCHEIITRTAEWFAVNAGHDGQTPKMPNTAAFAHRYRIEHGKDFVTIGIGDSGGYMATITVRRDLPADELKALVEARREELGIAKALPTRTVEESKQILREFEAPKVVRETKPSKEISDEVKANLERLRNSR
jgi:hypothetical protein